jgi:hypothetical protein
MTTHTYIHVSKKKSVLHAGLDTQAVLDGVASHACNSLTAMFHLLVTSFLASLLGKPDLIEH